METAAPWLSSSSSSEWTFLTDLSKMRSTNETSLLTVELLLKSVNSGIPLLDNTIENLTVTTSNSQWNTHIEGNVLIGGLRPGQLFALLRTGDLEAVLRRLNPNINRNNIPREYSRAFLKLIGYTPERALHLLNNIISTNKDKHKDLNICPYDLQKSPAGFKALQKIATIEENIKCVFPIDTVIPLTIGGVFIVGKTSILDATKARRGCFLLTTVGTKTTSCKMTAASCGPKLEPYGHVTPCDISALTGRVVNTYLAATTLFNLPRTSKYRESFINGIANGNGDGSSKPELTLAELKQMLVGKRKTSEAFYQMQQVHGAASEIYPQTGRNIFQQNQACSEAGIPGANCVMCDPTEDPFSPQFIAANKFPFNTLFYCGKDPKLIELISDIMFCTGQDVLSLKKNKVSENANDDKSSLWIKLQNLLLTSSVLHMALMMILLLFILAWAYLHIRLENGNSSILSEGLSSDDISMTSVNHTAPNSQSNIQLLPHLVWKD